jgi:hypothetical protein
MLPFVVVVAVVVPRSWLPCQASFCSRDLLLCSSLAHQQQMYSFDVKFELACVSGFRQRAAVRQSARVKRQEPLVGASTDSMHCRQSGGGLRSQLGGGGWHLTVGVYGACKACTENRVQGALLLMCGLGVCVCGAPAVESPQQCDWSGKVLLPNWPLNRPRPCAGA